MGYLFGAFRPATGEAFTRPYDARSSANWVDFLEQVEAESFQVASAESSLAEPLMRNRAKRAIDWSTISTDLETTTVRLRACLT